MLQVKVFPLDVLKCGVSWNQKAASLTLLVWEDWKRDISAPEPSLRRLVGEEPFVSLADL